MEDVEGQDRSQLCCNCNSPLTLSYSPSSSWYSQLNLDNLEHDQKLPSELSVNEMLSSIYKLNFLTTLSSSTSASSSSSSRQVAQRKRKIKNKTHVNGNENDSEKKETNLCGACTPLLQNLYSLYCQFNDLRPIDSQLAKDIQALDQLVLSLSLSLIKEQQKNKVHSQSHIISKISPKGCPSSSGPWVKVGKRIEDIEFETLGYAPRSLGHLFQRPEPEPEQAEDPLKLSSVKSWSRTRSKSKLKQVDSNSLSKDVEDDLEIQDNMNCHEFKIQVDDVPNGEDEEVDVKLFSDPLTTFDIVSEGDSSLEDEEEKQDDDEEEEWKPPTKSKSKVKKSTTTTKRKRIIESSDTALKPQRKRGRSKVNAEPEIHSEIAESDSKVEEKPEDNHTEEKSSQNNVKADAESEAKIKSKRRRNKGGKRGGSRKGSKRGKYKPRTKPNNRNVPMATCPIEGCGRELSACQINNHIRLVHEREKTGPWVCNLPKIVNGVLDTSGELCTYSTPKRFLLTRHQQTLLHQEELKLTKVPCKECGVLLSSQVQLRIHMYKRHTEKGIQAYIQSQKTSSEAKKAERREANAKGFICQICQVDFITKPKLTNHMMAVHKEYGSKYKPYICEICGKTCLGKYRLNQHVTTVHSEEKPFMCSICGNRYKQQTHLMQHTQRAHTEEGRLKFNKYISDNMKRNKKIMEALAQSNQQKSQQQQHNIIPDSYSSGQVSGSSSVSGSVSVGGENPIPIIIHGNLWEGNLSEFEGMSRL